jgi:hypothetical protein
MDSLITPLKLFLPVSRKNKIIKGANQQFHHGIA